MNSYQTMPEYNGWTNKPTWLLNLHFEPTQDDYILEQAKQICTSNKSEEAMLEEKYELADWLKEYYSDYVWEIGKLDDNIFIQDMFEFTFAYINWDEIAGHVIEQLKYNED